MRQRIYLPNFRITFRGSSSGLNEKGKRDRDKVRDRRERREKRIGSQRLERDPVKG